MRKRYIPLMTRISCLFGALIVLACALLSAFSYRLKLQSHVSELASQNTMLLRTMAQSIDTQLAQVEIIVREMAYDAETIQLLRDKSQPRQILSILFSVGKKLQQNETYLSALDMDMVLLSVDDTMVESYDTLVHETRLADNAFYADFLSQPRLSGWGGAEANLFSTSEEIVLPYYHKVITGLNTRVGAVRCTVRADRLFSPLMEYGEVMAVREGERLFGAEEIAAPVRPARTGTWREGDSLYSAAPLDRLNASLVIRESYSSIRAAAMRDIALSMLMIFLLGVALLLATRQVIRAMLSRLHRLTEAVAAIPEGDIAIALPEDGPDEVGRLSRAFSSLLEQVNAYYDELLQKEKDKRHAQTMALQYQINPHFLFNSLYWLQLQMEERGVDEALTASIEQLGQVLHYNMLGSRLALLSEEEEQILAYVGFVGAMKENRIRLSIHMPEELKNAQILRFTLQPLLENAISHGFIPGKDLHIGIEFATNEAEGLFEIAVHNDGRQIPPDRLAELQERADAAALDGIPMADQKGHGTALNNLARRLALTYGSVARLLVESGEGDTCIRILLPLHQCLRREDAHENPDRG